MLCAGRHYSSLTVSCVQVTTIRTFGGFSSRHVALNLRRTVRQDPSSLGVRHGETEKPKHSKGKAQIEAGVQSDSRAAQARQRAAQQD